MKRLHNLMGVDSAIFFTVFGRVVSSGIGLLTLFFVSQFLTPTVQGYFYTFYSLIALQMFIELGLSLTLVQFASHEVACLSWAANGSLIGRPESLRRLQSLLQFAFRWIGIAALAMLAVLVPLGLTVFTSTPVGEPLKFAVRTPWTLFVVFSALNMLLSASVSIIEGCGRVADVAFLRLSQSIFSALVLWLTFVADGNLYALAASSLAALVVGLIWLWRNFRPFLQTLLLHHIPLPGMSWRKEIWPFQWRIAVSSMGGFFVSHPLGPILFVYEGPVAAGQLGMTMQIVGALNGIALAWISTKAPVYGQLIATNQTEALDAIFWRGLLQSLVILLAGMSAILIGYYSIIDNGSTYAHRVLSQHLIMIVCITGIATHIVSSEAAYLRAHKREPFMMLSLLSGALSTTSALLLVPHYGSAGAIYSYAVSVLLVGLVGGSFVFFRMRKQWAQVARHCHSNVSKN